MNEKNENNQPKKSDKKNHVSILDSNSKLNCNYCNESMLDKLDKEQHESVCLEVKSK